MTLEMTEIALNLEKEMTIQPSIFTWKIPWTEEPGRAIVHRVTGSQTRLKRLSMRALKLWIALGSIVILSKLIIPIQEHHYLPVCVLFHFFHFHL